jgi:hypothetical protein
MTPFGRCSAVIITALLLVMCMTSNSQTLLDMRSQARNLDFSGAAWTRPVPVGTTLPAACAKGQIYFKTDAAPGRNLFLCSATNLWSAVAASTPEADVPSPSNQAGKILGTDGQSISWRGVAGFTDNGSQFTPDGTVLGELSGNNIWTGHAYFPASATQNLVAATDTITCNRRTVAISSTSALTLTSAPTIPDGADGQVCVIVNVGTFPITMQRQDCLPSSNLQLLSTQVLIPAKSQLRLQFNAAVGDWIQEGQYSVPVPALPLATPGDLVVRSTTANVRLPVGANGTVLMANSARQEGVEWASPAAPVTIDTDPDLTASNDTVVASQKATKTYADTKVAASAIDPDSMMAADSDTRVASQKAAKAYADTKMAASAIDTDATMAANSDTRVASQKAAKAYADTKIGASSIDTDATLAATSDMRVASQKATKAYADTKLSKIASGTVVVPATQINAGTCVDLTPVTATGVVSTDVINFNANAKVTTLLGWNAAGTLVIWPTPQTDAVLFTVCNKDPNNAVTPASITLNWRVGR